MGRNARVRYPGKADVHEKHPVLGLERENSPSSHQLLTAGRIPVSRSAFGTVDFCSTVIIRRAATGSHIEHAQKLADRTVAAKCSKNLTQPAHFFFSGTWLRSETLFRHAGEPISNFRRKFADFDIFRHI